MKRAFTLDMRDEVNGMRFRDHSIRSGKSALSIEINRYQRIKTSRANDRIMHHECTTNAPRIMLFDSWRVEFIHLSFPWTVFACVRFFCFLFPSCVQRPKIDSQINQISACIRYYSPYTYSHTLSQLKLFFTTYACIIENVNASRGGTAGLVVFPVLPSFRLHNSSCKREGLFS